MEADICYFAATDRENALATTAGHRYRALDGLRGVAALFVVFYHAPWTTHFSGMRMVGNAYLAVDFFFILSGFVIAANYADRIVDGASARAFMLTRFFRLYPLHFAVLMVLVAQEAIKLAAQGALVSDVAPFTGPNSISLLIENLCMAQGLGLENRLGWNPPSWSVGAEFVAYFLFALLAIGGALRSRGFVLALAALAFVSYFAIAATQNTLDATYGLGLLRCLAGFSLGVAIQFFSPAAGSGDARPARMVAVALILCLGTLAFAQGAVIFAAIPLFVALVATLQFDQGLAARLLSTRPAQFLGRVSYSIYMIHVPLLAMAAIFLKRALHVPSHFDGRRQIIELSSPWIGDLAFALVLVAVLALSWAAFTWIEEPSRLFGRRLAARPASAPEAPLVPRQTI